MITWHDFDTFQPKDYQIYLLVFKSPNGVIFTHDHGFTYVSGSDNGGWGRRISIYGKPLKIAEFPEYKP